MVWGEGSDCGQGSCLCGVSLSPASCSWLVWHAVNDGEVWGHSRSRREEGADLNSRLLWVQVRELPCAAGSVNDGLAAGAPKFVLSMVMCWLTFRVCGGILPWERVWHMGKVGELALGGPVDNWAERVDVLFLGWSNCLGRMRRRASRGRCRFFYSSETLLGCCHCFLVILLLSLRHSGHGARRE